MKGKLKQMMMVMLLAVVLVASGCASNKQAGENASNESSQQEVALANDEAANEQVETDDVNEQTTAEEASATRQYEHMAGSSVIPAKPERVVTDWYYGQLVALGLKPIGTDDYVLNNHPFIDKEGTESIGQSLEKVIELQPDLIIAWGADKYEDYSKIAPTIPLELSGGPIETVRIFGDILGREAEAEQWISAFESNTAAARERLQDKVEDDDTFSIISVWRDTIRVYGFVNMGGYVLYEALQLNAPPEVDNLFRNSEEWYAAISLEMLPEYTGSHIILTAYDGADMLQELKNSAVWNGLDAVKNNNVYEVDFNLLYNDDPVAIEHQVQLLAELIE